MSPEISSLQIFYSVNTMLFFLFIFPQEYCPFYRCQAGGIDLNYFRYVSLTSGQLVLYVTVIYELLINSVLCLTKQCQS